MTKRSNLPFGRTPRRYGIASPAALSKTAALFAEGLAHHQAGRLAEAENIYRRVLAMRPDHFDSLHLLGVVFLQRCQYEQAVRQIDVALRQNPNNVNALNNRGTALKELKRFGDALASYDRALKLKPDYADAHSNRGNILKELRRFDEALASYDHALALKPDFAGAHSNRADALHRLKRFADALQGCDRALKLAPNFAEAHCNRGNALHGLRRFEEALESFDRALALKPDFAEAHCNRGSALNELNRFADALAAYDSALALKPDFAEAHTNRGNALNELFRLEEALASHDRAVALRPDLAEAYSNRGSTLKDLRQHADALASFDRALALQPDFAHGRFNASLCRLLIGDFARGWPQYEARWDTVQLEDYKRNFTKPQWHGGNDIAGTILIHAEQGFGDTLQFCRYVPRVAARGGHVIFEVQPPLRELMRTLPGVEQIVAAGEPLPDFDLHCPLLSLPLAFGTELETIPGETPYLRAPQDRSAAWRARCGEHDRVRVGLVWAGNPRKEVPHAHRVDRLRSITFDRLAPLFDIVGCAFYSLQKGDSAATQLRVSALRYHVTDWTDELNDFSDTAALIENLDLVIAVDTAVAHLAGALGKPFWLMNRDNTCWRWLLDRDDSPWYPAARLFRQDATRNWGDVIACVAAALQDYVRSR
jgi:tetratricopeptide (TPR) repeat protein